MPAPMLAAFRGKVEVVERVEVKALGRGLKHRAAGGFERLDCVQHDFEDYVIDGGFWVIEPEADAPIAQRFSRRGQQRAGQGVPAALTGLASTSSASCRSATVRGIGPATVKSKPV